MRNGASFPAIWPGMREIDRLWSELQFSRLSIDRRKENARIERTNPGYDKPVTAGFYGDPVRGVV
jgi:hypothetical protein